MSFEVDQGELRGGMCLQFSGSIDEEAHFPKINDMPTEVIIDLKNVSAINSIGIRSWINWFSSYPQVNFVFINCPKSLVMQMNMVQGFLPELHRVESIEVPFYCETCDKERSALFYVGKEIITEGEQVRLEYDKGDICMKPSGDGPDCELDLDVSEKKFFRFLTAS